MKKILLILTLIFGITCNAYTQDDSRLKVSVNLFDGGQDSFNLADVIEARQGSSVADVVLNRKGLLSKRKGQALFANDLSDTAFTGLGTYIQDESNIIAASGPSVIKSDTSSTDWEIINSVSGEGLTTGKDTEFFQANKILLVLNGSDRTANWDGSDWEPGVDSSASPPIATTGAWQLNYAFYAGDTTNPDWIYFSNNLNPRTLTNTDIIKVNTGDGQDIIRLETFRENELIVYKERSVFVLDLSGDTPLDDWTVQPLSKSIGCIALRSVVNIGNDHIFLSSEPIAVRSLKRSSFDKILLDMLSVPIQDIFDGTGDTTINRTIISKACAILFDDKYILAIPTGTSTVNNTVVVFDLITKGWYVINGWFPASWVEFNKNLYYIDANDGRVIECFTGTTGDMTEGPQADTFAASEPTVAINYTYVSRNFDFDNPENFKMPDALDVEFAPEGSWDATLSIELDDGGFQEIGTVNLAGDAPTLPVDLPFDLSAGGIVRQTFHLQQYGEFKKIKVKIVQNGLSQTIRLKRYAIFAVSKPWRRE